ncbi:hypothetical protein ACIRRA_44600 [Nocardia sp. NPDC101769]|uniref:hypothetical protein n=1 Tax=Nocardia sp. NPDC101769 TaxID=3364333 RepID=UPI0038274DDD
MTADVVTTVTTKQMQKQFSPLSKQAAAHGFVVVTWDGAPGAVMMSGEAWASAQREDEQLVVPEAECEQWAATDVPAKLAALHETMCAGRHVAALARGRLRAMIAPADWARRAFPLLGLPDSDAPEPAAADQVLVMYRSRRAVQGWREEFADSPDPDREMDRRLSAGPTAIPLARRAQLRAVVYVLEGEVVRVRAVDTAGEWVELPGGTLSLAPVSDPLSHSEIDALLPGLGMYPGQPRAAAPGVRREFLDL